MHSGSGCVQIAAMKTKSKKSKASKQKARKPFTISVHGEGLDIDASFAGGADDDGDEHSAFGDSMTLLVDAVVRRLNGSPPAAAQGVSATPVDSVFLLVSDLAKSVTPEQIAQWEATATPVQKTIAMEILNIVQPFSEVNAARSNGHSTTGRVVQ